MAVLCALKKYKITFAFYVKVEVQVLVQNWNPIAQYMEVVHCVKNASSQEKTPNTTINADGASWIYSLRIPEASITGANQRNTLCGRQLMKTSLI